MLHIRVLDLGFFLLNTSQVESFPTLAHARYLKILYSKGTRFIFLPSTKKLANILRIWGGNELRIEYDRI